MLEYENRFEIRIVNDASLNEIDHYYELYKNVSAKNKEISVFDVNKKFFEKIIKHPNWELIELKLKPEHDTRKTRSAVGFVISYRTQDNYCGLIAGIDYDFAEENNVYPQTMWQTILRANHHKSKKLFLGYTASQNKRKFGAKVLKNVAYVQMKDNFNSQIISLIANKK